MRSVGLIGYEVRALAVAEDLLCRRSVLQVAATWMWVALQNGLPDGAPVALD